MSQKENPWKMVALVGAIGMDLSFCTLAGFYGGQYLDGRFGTSPLFLLVGLLGGLAIGIYGVYLLIQSFIGD